ncbi:MAG: transcriptional repressor [Muribaculum sp.]|nr:transcriptional repressor [Muribaculum sp.]
MNDEKRKITAENKLSHYLEQHRMRRTPERYAILDKILGIKSRFSADYVLASLVSDAYHVSRATVYNAFNLFEACGLIRRMPLTQGAEEYEFVEEQAGHIHLVCAKCGRFRDVKDADLVKLLSHKRFSSFVMTGFDLYISGNCVKCKGNSKK